MSVRYRIGWPAALALLHLLLATLYSDSLPILEGPDEHDHIGVIEYIVTNDHFPVLGPDTPLESHQPPLYYLLGALIAESNPRIEDLPHNPHWGYSINRYSGDNNNLFLHTRVEERPYQGQSLTVHLLRSMSGLLGVLRIFVTLAIARAALPSFPRVGIAATAFVALLPFQIAASATVNNDALATLVGSVVIYLTLRATKRSPNWRDSILVGAVTGILWLSKLTLTILLPFLWLAALGSGRLFRRPYGPNLRRLLIMTFVSIAIAGGWFYRNYQIYGDWTGATAFDQQYGNLGFFWHGWDWYLAQLWHLHQSFWVVFSREIIVAPPMIYWLCGVVTAASIFGLIKWAVGCSWNENKLDSNTLLLLISITGLAIVASIAYPLVNIHGSNPRLFLSPSLPAIALLLCLGWRNLLPQHWRGSIALGLLLTGLVSLALYSFSFVLRPAFARPILLEDGELPTQLISVGEQFDDLAELVGVVVPDERASPGDEIIISACWLVTGQTKENLIEFVHLVRLSDAHKIGARDTHPGLGNFPTSDWQPGELFCDAIPIQINEDAPAPGIYAVLVGLYSTDPDQAYNQSVIAENVTLAPPAQAMPSSATLMQAQFDAAIELRGYEVTDTNLTLYWHTIRSPGEGWVLFAHLFDSAGLPVLLLDAPPLAGEFPTSAWQADDLITETRNFKLPEEYTAGLSQWLIGWYRPDSLERLPATQSGERVLNDAVLIPGPTLP